MRGSRSGRRWAKGWRGAFALAALLGASATARAASDDAWDALFKAAAAACISASGLAGAQAIGTPTDFSDRVLVLVRGRWPQPHMKAAPPATFACLYPKSGGEAGGKSGGKAEANEIRLP